MYDHSIRERAVAMFRQGVTNRVVADSLGVPRGTVGWWRSEDRRRRGESYVRPTECPLCTGQPFDQPAYSYLLGLYLGDGHIVSRRKQHHLSVVQDNSYPGLIEAIACAMRSVMPKTRVGQRQRPGCTEIKSYTMHWRCMFPQHGPGKKHERVIALEPWQQAIVDAYPWEFIRGLVHSDGCRITNWTTRMVAGERKRYEYPRYFFTNVSDDIRRLYCEALDRVGVEWKATRRGDRVYNISVARREAVALMDCHVGPKH